MSALKSQEDLDRVFTEQLRKVAILFDAMKDNGETPSKISRFSATLVSEIVALIHVIGMQRENKKE